MPALSPSVSLLGALIQSNGSANSSLSLNAANNTSQSFDVICAWPVSGQYGPGSRFLYYVLVATCVLGRGSEWLKGACLAAALLIPAVAALHAIVLAAVHVDGAVDMDVYGAFQICAIGVLAGPVTVKISKTYFNTPGRNLIFLWTGMILSGLLSLTVEFFRATPVSCLASDFSWGEDECGLVCSPDHGPASPLRGGSQDNIYVIKAPHRLPLGTATLLSAACCIPAILSLVSMWNKILKLNWTKRFGGSQGMEELNEPIPGTNSTTAKMNNVNDRIRFYLSMVEIPVFGAAIFAILIVGERNFFDYRVNYMTEPIASVGQWAPIVGTGLAAMGSLYALLAADGNGKDEMNSEKGTHHCDCPHHPSNDAQSIQTPPQAHVEGEIERSRLENEHDGSTMARRQTYESSVVPSPTRQMSRTATRGTSDHTSRRGTIGAGSTAGSVDVGSRRKVARAFELIGDKLGTPAPNAFDDSDFLTGRAADFPTVPAEEQRNPGLPKIMASYNPPRDSDGNATPNLAMRRQRSRGGSFNGSVASGLGIDRLCEAELNRADTATGHSRPSVEGMRTRRDTLEVPQPTYVQGPATPRETSFASASDPPGKDDGDQDPTSPTIRISHESSQ